MQIILLIDSELDELMHLEDEGEMEAMSDTDDFSDSEGEITDQDEDYDELEEGEIDLEKVENFEDYNFLDILDFDFNGGEEEE